MEENKITRKRGEDTFFFFLYSVHTKMVSKTTHTNLYKEKVVPEATTGRQNENQPVALSSPSFRSLL